MFLAVCNAVAVSALPVREPVTLAVIVLVTLIVSTYRYAHLLVVDPRDQVEPTIGIIVFAVEDAAVKLPFRSPLKLSYVAVVPTAALIYP